MKNREFGSDFNLIVDSTDAKHHFFNGLSINYFFSGRVAIYNLLREGIDKFGWKKVGFPSYYCHEVVEYCKDLRIEIVYYNYNPFSPLTTIDWEDTADNVFINVDFFGIGKIDVSFLSESIVIEDLTHNLRSILSSNADFVFASLRKQLPCPSGGICISKNNILEFKLSQSNEANKIAWIKASAMLLKSLYLENEMSDKSFFRQLFVKSEEMFSSKQTDTAMPDISRFVFDSIDLDKVISKTQENLLYVLTKLVSTSNILINKLVHTQAMGLIYYFNDFSSRENFRNYLIENKVYPAVLWPDQIEPNDILLQNQILFVHVDFRYSQTELDYLIGLINKFFKNEKVRNT